MPITVAVRDVSAQVNNGLQSRFNLLLPFIKSTDNFIHFC